MLATPAEAGDVAAPCSAAIVTSPGSDNANRAASLTRWPEPNMLPRRGRSRAKNEFSWIVFIIDECFRVFGTITNTANPGLQKETADSPPQTGHEVVERQWSAEGSRLSLATTPAEVVDCVGFRPVDVRFGLRRPVSPATPLLRVDRWKQTGSGWHDEEDADALFNEMVAAEAHTRTDSMKCQRCQIALQSRTYEADVQVDECPGCGGLWLDARELERIEEVVANDYKVQLASPDYLPDRSYEMALQKSRPDICCPKCGQPMSKTECHPTSMVLVDVCPGCAGLWMDRGEVQSLEVFFERMRLEEREAAKLGLVATLWRLFGGAG